MEQGLWTLAPERKRASVPFHGPTVKRNRKFLGVARFYEIWKLWFAEKAWPLYNMLKNS